MKNPKNHVVEVEVIWLPSSNPWAKAKVVRAGDKVLLGFLEKHADVAGEVHPWKAFLPKFVAGSPAQFGEFIGAYYGGKLEAIKAMALKAYGPLWAVKEASGAASAEAALESVNALLPEGNLRYSAAAVDAAIESSNRSGRHISKREAALIHGLLKGGG